MSAEQIRGMAKAPSHPFLVRAAGGESYKMARPELFWIDPEVR